MRDFNENVGKSNPAHVAFDLEIEAIERDFRFEFDKAIRICVTEGGPAGDLAASMLRRARCIFYWRRHHALGLRERQGRCPTLPADARFGQRLVYMIHFIDLAEAGGLGFSAEDGICEFRLLSDACGSLWELRNRLVAELGFDPRRLPPKQSGRC
jgi:hypothetical protein